ncbi:MAG: flavin reductase family protein [Chloracidobacterium sp.]|nr:flavin reductase family protein [Chloracidobacterium sp.]
MIDALASIECRLQHAYDGGDHTIFVGKVEHATANQGTPLIYHQAEYKNIKS